MKIVLDTNAYCDYAEAVPRVVDILAELGERIFLPSVVVGELRYGFLKGNRRDYNERKLREIVRELQIEIINVDDNVASKYAVIYDALVRAGRKIPINDVWIAACCMEVGGTLLTRDKHFNVVAQIEALFL